MLGADNCLLEKFNADDTEEGAERKRKPRTVTKIMTCTLLIREILDVELNLASQGMINGTQYFSI